MEANQTSIKKETGIVSVGKRLEKYIHLVSRWLNTIGIVSLVLMTLFMVVDVSGRYLFKKPLPGSIDLITLTIVLLVFPALAYCASQDGNVKVDVLYLRFPKRTRAVLDIICSFLSVVFVALMAWRLGARGIAIIGDPPGPTTLYFLWPLMPFILLASFGTLVLCLELIIWFAHSISNVRKI